MANFPFALMPSRFSLDDNSSKPQYAVLVRVVRLERGKGPIPCPRHTQAFAFRRIAAARKAVAENARWTHSKLCRPVSDVTATRVRAQTRTAWHHSLVVASSHFAREDGFEYRRTIEVVAL